MADTREARVLAERLLIGHNLGAPPRQSYRTSQSDNRECLCGRPWPCVAVLASRELVRLIDRDRDWRRAIWIEADLGDTNLGPEDVAEYRQAIEATAREAACSGCRGASIMHTCGKGYEPPEET